MIGFFVVVADRSSYGDDGLDPAGMEAREKPVDFTRVLAHVKAVQPTSMEPALDISGIENIVEAALSGKFSVLTQRQM